MEQQSLKGKTALITGASMGIGAAIAARLAEAGVHVGLMSRSADKLAALRDQIRQSGRGLSSEVRIGVYAADVQDHAAVDGAVAAAAAELGGQIDILVNNAGLAVGAPARFWELDVEQIDQMAGTNVRGVMYATHSVLNRSMWPRRKGDIINVSSVTGLEIPPFPGESVYHASKAFLEGFSNSLRGETAGSDIRVLTLRPGCVDTHFHLQRVKYDQNAMDEFFKGYEPLVADDLAESVVCMLSLPTRISWKALDCVPTAQRSLAVFDREWNERRG